MNKYLKTTHDTIVRENNANNKIKETAKKYNSEVFENKCNVTQSKAMQRYKKCWQRNSNN